MKRFFNIALLSSLLALFVFSDLAMGQVFRSRLSSNRSGAMVTPKDVYTKDGVKLSVDTPLHILEETAKLAPEFNERTRDEDWTIPNAASFYLGQCYLLGYNGCPKDEKKAAIYFNQIFARWTVGVEEEAGPGRNQRIQSPEIESHYMPSPVKESPNDLMSNYITRIRQEAENGNVESQTKLGKYYFLGMGVKSNPQESAKWIRHAAEQGNADAQEMLARYYAGGYGVRASRTEALKWLNRSYRSTSQQTYTPLRINTNNTPSVNTSRSMSLERGDVILEVNGERVDGSGALTDAINRSPQTVYLTVRDRRNGQIIELSTTLRSSRPRLGLTGQPHPDGGARITQVDRNSPATRCYLVE